MPEMFIRDKILTTSLYSTCIIGLDVDVDTRLFGILREKAFEHDSYGAI